MKKISKHIGILWFALTFAATASWAGSEKLSSELQSSNLSSRLDVIVQYKVPPTKAHYQKIANLGGVLRKSLDVIRAAYYTVPRSALGTLSSDPDVTFISPNRTVKGMLNIAAGAVHSDVANSLGFKGKGIGV